MDNLNSDSRNLYLYEIFNLKSVDKSWKIFFDQEKNKSYFNELLIEVKKEYKNTSCHPERKDIFRIFREISLDKIKVVILGQDPYHQPGVADGIAFSTQKPNYIPRTLENIFSELSKDLKCAAPNKGSLLPWVKQGVFLINTTLTVKTGTPLSHFEIWKRFVNNLIKFLKSHSDNFIWVFWGKKAQLVKNEFKFPDEKSIVGSHPSPYSAKYGFFKSRPFSKINKLLEKNGQEPINWLTI